jgi:predicted RecB family endonuclease
MSDEARSSIDDIIELYKRDVDRTLIRERFKRSVEERLEDLMELQRFAEELRAAGRRSTSSR